jgi:RNA polymerase sigma-70 factor (ECF subfamily)
MGAAANIRSTVEFWYQQHGAALLLFGTALTGDRGRAQDAVHQVFLRLLEYEDLGHIADIRTYLFAAVRNRIIHDARRGGFDTALEESWFESPKRDYVEELSIRRALAGLPEDQRAVTVLHIWGGLTFAQVAEVLGINANTAAARYRYALAKLRDKLSTQKEVEANERPDG